MSSHGYSDVFVRMKIDDLMREVENDRLASLAAGPQRPLRARIADWLVAAAERIEGRPQGSIYESRAEA
jgi:hypothetical protein